ncbi:hypothetical protein HMPREF0484_1035 [Klebsiella pneumoniae subsp. rhinoscleromatis ATCC 13884]|nr:hypothetical protein HMPREF0484_1035 [Klebsiella pneumoniae subsp. rhinoscleromatis ATCC 13884]STT68579.1 Uncharacterised protein [Klebsiella pneumoniae]STV63691.1 Uncharacterised protein [Klebsiella pneumoniae subsp. rhinoscleromatis]STU10693.1 Uncharacterised protein [Klebsiella pneumoniae]STW03448.1 Uncharacterised protein [Klebsiella pneumoniae subsp. rhinoscleromatis]
MSFKPGFIAPPWPHVLGDSVSARSLISRIEQALCGTSSVTSDRSRHNATLNLRECDYTFLTMLHDSITSALEDKKAAHFEEEKERKLRKKSAPRSSK